MPFNSLSNHFLPRLLLSRQFPKIRSKSDQIRQIRHPCATADPTAHRHSHIMSRLTRFRQLPLTLYRIQPRLQVSLRDFDTQMAKKRESYDLKLHNGLVLPMTGDTFHTPNGMSLRPNSDTMVRILNQFRGDVNVYSILQGTILPDDLVVIHEHTDHYSMQTTVPVSLPDLNAKMTELLSKCMCVTREEFLARLEDLDDQDN